MKEDLKCKHHNIYVVRRDNSVDITCQWCRDCGAFKFSREEWDFPTRPAEKMELQVKLPEKKRTKLSDNYIVQANFDGWNAALDKVREMNGLNNDK